MKALKASHIMVRPVVSARKNATARDIALQLLTGLYSGMPVTDDQGHIIGVVTEFDLVEAVQAGKELTKTTAEEIMTTEVVTADVDTPVSELIKIRDRLRVGGVMRHDVAGRASIGRDQCGPVRMFRS